MEWGPGDNKAWVMPAKASLVEVKDAWEQHASTVAVLEAAGAEPSIPAPSAAAVAVAEAAPAVALADSIAASEAEARELHVVTMPPVATVATGGASAPEHVAISTMENIEAEEVRQKGAVGCRLLLRRSLCFPFLRKRLAGQDACGTARRNGHRPCQRPARARPRTHSLNGVLPS